MVKLCKHQVSHIKRLLEDTDLTHQEIANMFNVTRGHITKIKNNKRWNIIYNNGRENQTECENKR